MATVCAGIILRQSRNRKKVGADLRFLKAARLPHLPTGSKSVGVSGSSITSSRALTARHGNFGEIVYQSREFSRTFQANDSIKAHRWRMCVFHKS